MTLYQEHRRLMKRQAMRIVTSTEQVREHPLTLEERKEHEIRALRLVNKMHMMCPTGDTK